METLENSKDTSIPAYCSMVVPNDAWRERELDAVCLTHRHSEGRTDPKKGRPRPVTPSRVIAERSHNVAGGVDELGSDNRMAFRPDPGPCRRDPRWANCVCLR